MPEHVPDLLRADDEETARLLRAARSRLLLVGDRRRIVPSRSSDLLPAEAGSPRPQETLVLLRPQLLRRFVGSGRGRPTFSIGRRARSRRPAAITGALGRWSTETD